MFVTAIVLRLVLFFVLSSSLLIKKAAAKFAPGYHISYTSIKGNLLSGIKIDNLRFKEERLAESIYVKWQLHALFTKTIALSNLTMEKVNVDAVKSLIASFESNESNQSGSFDFAVEAKDIDVFNVLIPTTVVIKKLQTDILPVAYAPVKISSLILQGEDIHFNVQKRILKSASFDLKGTTNLTNFDYRGEAQDNRLTGEIHIKPNRALFDYYNLAVRHESIKDVMVDFNASTEYIVAEIKASAGHILDTKKGEFNIDIERFWSHVTYDIKKGKLTADSKARVTTPYAKNVRVSNLFFMDGDISYRGEIEAREFTGIDEKFTALLSNLKIKYSGDEKSIKTVLSSEQLKGTFNIAEFKQGILHVETKEPIKVSKLMELPEELKEAKVNARVDLPVDLAHIFPMNAKVKIRSNVANIDADVLYSKTLQIKARTILPEDSLLRTLSQEVKWDALTPLDMKFELADKSAVLVLKAKEFYTDITYLLENKTVDGKIELAGFSVNISGTDKNQLNIESHITSIKSLQKSLNTFYDMQELPSLEGPADISAVITDRKRADISFGSPQLLYKADSKTTHIVNDIRVSASVEKSKIVLKNYTLTYNQQKFFSTKPSQIEIDEESIKIDSLWFNDELNATGKYNLKTRKGKLTAKAANIYFMHKYADINSDIDIETTLDGNSTSVTGKITLLGGKIKYDMRQKSFASDSDIIIVQEMNNKKKASPFMDNLSVNIQIETKKPLVYKQGPINVKIKADLGINKVEYGPLLLLGSVELLRGGSYIFEDKKFILDQSFVHFAGNPNKPLLEIKVKYQALNHLISIDISGTPDAPNIHFSSIPALTKEQILSVILFDSESGGGTHTVDEMMKMMGGAIAKSALSHLGVKIDYLVLGEGNSIEVGKKLTRKITVIYLNDEVSGVKLKYQHGKRTESVIEVNEESQSYDIIYKMDF